MASVLRLLVVMDEYTRESLAIDVARHFSGQEWGAGHQWGANFLPGLQASHIYCPSPVP